MVEGKVAIVTGGGQGIGKHAARTLAAAGAKVAIADINPETVAATVKELGTISAAMPVPLDVRNEDDVKAAFAEVAGEFGGIDILVNNAAIVPHFRWGLPRWPHVEDMPEEFWDKVVRTNLYGTFFCTKQAVPHMKARGAGHVINLFGGGGIKPGGAMAYMVTKSGIRMFTRYFAEEVRDDNICAVTFSPRWQIATETASDEVRQELPGPEILGDAFVLAAQLPLESSGLCFAYEDGKLVKEGPMEA